MARDRQLSLLGLDRECTQRQATARLDCGGALERPTLVSEELMRGVGAAFTKGRTGKLTITLPGRGPRRDGTRRSHASARQAW